MTLNWRTLLKRPQAVPELHALALDEIATQLGAKVGEPWELPRFHNFSSMIAEAVRLQIICFADGVDFLSAVFFSEL